MTAPVRKPTPPKLPRPVVFDDDLNVIDAPTYQVGVATDIPSLGFVEASIGPPQDLKPDGPPSIQVEGKWRPVTALIDQHGADQIVKLRHYPSLLEDIEVARPEQSWDEFWEGPFVHESTSIGNAISVARPEPIEWVVEGLVPDRALTVLVGQPKSGKTRLATAIGLALASGRKVFGRHAIRRGRVLMYLLEDPEFARNRILSLSCAGLDVSQDQIDVLPVRLARPSIKLRLDLPLRAGEHDDPDANEGGEALLNEIGHFKPALVIIDSLRRVHRRDESSSTDMGPVMEALRELTRDAAVLLIHHPRQHSPGDERRPPGELLRGTSDLRALARSIIGLHRGSDGHLNVAVEGNYVDGVQRCRLRVEEDERSLRYQIIEEAGEDDALVLAAVRERAGSGAELEARLKGMGAPRIRAAVKRLSAAKLISKVTQERRRKNGRPQDVEVWAVNPRSLVSRPNEGSVSTLVPDDPYEGSPTSDDEVLDP